MEGRLDIGRVQRGRLDEGQVVLLGESASLFRRNCTKVSEIGLVADQHDDDISVGMVTKLAKPAFDILVSQMLGNVVDQESSNSTTVVPKMTS